MIFIQQIAYEYLCRLEEARVWISKCVDEELPPVGKGVLEDSLRNGVHLAKLAASFAPHIVQVIIRSDSENLLILKMYQNKILII